MPQKPPNLVYGLEDTLPLPTALLLGLQHVFVMSTAFIFPVVIVRSFGGSAEQAAFMVTMSILAGGVGTILQALRKQGMGSGYLCPAVCGPSYLSASLLAAQTGGLSLVYGMTAFAGLFEVFFSRLMHRLRILFPAEVTGVVVTLVGVAVIPVAIPNFLGISPGDAVTEALELFVAAITLGTMVAISVWSRGKLRLYSVLVGITIGYILAAATGILGGPEIARILDAPLLALPDLSHPGWSFDLALLIPFTIAVLCSSLKSIGDLTTCQKINDAEWKRPDMRNIGGGILADGSSALLSGFIGGMGQSTSSSNVGLSIGTGATSRIIAFAAGVILILLTFFPKLASVFVVMPGPVMGAGLVFVAAFMIVNGLQIITSRMMDTRKTFVVGFAFIFGLSIDIFPDFFTGLPGSVQSVFSSSLALGTATALILNLIFRIGIARRKTLLLEPGTDFSDTIFTFFETMGGTWGARKEVIQRAESAVNELVESIVFLDATREAIRADIRFEEDSLDIDIRYTGKPLDLSPGGPPSDADLLEDDTALARLSAFLVWKYADSVTADDKDGECRIRLHFDH
ncbi:xanthine permease [Methanoculleus sp. FWC-SCC1]|uniref:Xanthine permease n=1 Tax=Methanoculleus frigidifontis TaxID=2584085 RepID=A0ABT8MAD3_9EURY|nr:solute carrier family 23 protein [Methanoculleus sp. FWC-SCC1]MDN7024897.1 xanthine permease [Methanoculleus sp. FWC-SCC1]